MDGSPLLDVLMSICCRGRDVTRFNLEVTGLNLPKVTKILNQLCLQVPGSVGVDGRALFNDVSAEPIVNERSTIKQLPGPS